MRRTTVPSVAVPFGSLFALVAILLGACAHAPAQDLGAALDGSLQTGAPQLPARPARLFTAEEPARIMVIGDSLSQGFADALKQRVAERGILAVVTNRGKVSTGLARSDFYDWPTAFAGLVAEEHPDIVVAHFGANDMQTVMRSENRAGYGSAGWDDAYRTEVNRILDVAAANRTVLMWLGPAPDGHAGLGKHMAHIAPLFRDEAVARGAIFLPLAAFTAGPEGEFVTTVQVGGKATTIRTGDMSHFNMTGYRLVADRILDNLIARFPALEPAPDMLAALQ